MNRSNILIPFILLFLMTILFSCEKDKDHNSLPVDGDGNKYDTIVIGTQTWLKQNLKTTTYRFGNPVRIIKDNNEWVSWQQGAFCWYDNNPNYKDIYGALYNYYAAHSQALCPDGWHIPTKAEWNILIEYCGGDLGKAGDKLKESGIQHWGINNRGTNVSGFTALPGGNRNFNDGSFEMIGQVAEFWVSDVASKMVIFNSQAGLVDWYKSAGLSVRCIKDK